MIVELSEHVTFEQAIDLVASGEEICGICDFVSEQKIIKKLTDHFFELQKIHLFTTAMVPVTIGIRKIIDDARFLQVDCIPHLFYHLELPPPKY